MLLINVMCVQPVRTSKRGLSHQGVPLFQLQLLLLVSLSMLTCCSSAHLRRPVDYDDDPDDANTLSAATRHLLRWARVEAVKRGILQQLGLTEAPRPPPRRQDNETESNATEGDEDDEMASHVMLAYRRSVQEATRVRNHVTGNDVMDDYYYDDDDVDMEMDNVPQAKQFYSFKGHVAPGTECDLSATDRNLHFRVEIPEPKEPEYEAVVTSATLRLHARPLPPAYLPSEAPLFYRVNVYHIVPAGRRPDGTNVTEIRHLVTSQTLRAIIGGDREQGEGKWEELDVTGVVKKHVLTNGGKAGVLQLEVKVMMTDLDEVHGHGHLRGGLEFGEECDGTNNELTHKHRPMLNVLTRDRPVHRSRSRRSATVEPVEPLCTPGDGETRCCRRALWISFHDIGWDNWILAPDGYQAYYCEGSCPPGHLTANRYASIRQLLVVAGLGGAGGRGAPPLPLPTCSATRLSPLPIVHYLNGRRVVSIFDDMIVEKCRCA